MIKELEWLFIGVLMAVVVFNISKIKQLEATINQVSRSNHIIIQSQQITHKGVGLIIEKCEIKK